MNLLDTAKSRFYHRLEKILLTIECILIAGAFYFCFKIARDQHIIMGILVWVVFLWEMIYKRCKINLERRKK